MLRASELELPKHCESDIDRRAHVWEYRATRIALCGIARTAIVSPLMRIETMNTTPQLSRELSSELADYIENIPSSVSDIEGLLSDKEMRFLALVTGTKLADGEVLEIGSYQGKSTAILAGAAKLAGDSRIAAIDPLHEEHLIANAADRGFNSLRAAFDHNLSSRGLREMVDFRQDFSQNVSPTWDRPLRFLWIDGDHRYDGTVIDFEGFAPHLADGGIVAFHDTLNHFEGSLRVFMERVLLSPHYGPCGVVGSISWARYFEDPKQAESYAGDKLKLYRRLAPLAPLLAFGRKPSGVKAKWFKLLRSRVPRREIAPQDWLKKVA